MVQTMKKGVTNVVSLFLSGIPELVRQYYPTRVKNPGVMHRPPE